MKHRISAGVLVEIDGRILLVRHCNRESTISGSLPAAAPKKARIFHATARREVLEECGLEVEPLKIAYAEELANQHTGTAKSGSPVAPWAAPEQFLTFCRPEHIVEAAWLSHS